MTTMDLMPATELTDQFEVLKCMIGNLCDRTGRKPFVVAFTSCEHGEGVTTTTVNFTAALIRDRQARVLLVDGNMTRPSLHRYFAIEPPEAEHGKRDRGVARREATQGIRDWQIIQANANLDVILSHTILKNDQRLVKITEFCDFLNWVKREYDYVIIDCPAMNRSSSAAVIASKADAVVLVVEAERIRHEVIQRSIATMEDLGANILGVVLNKRRYPIPGFIYKML